MFGTAKTLIVVYKDEMLVNQLKKLVESKDDSSDGQIVGTKDGSINIVAWPEKVWLCNKKAGNIKDKVLFLGDIKGSDKLIPVVDIKFDEFGAKYGWAGNQAILFAEPKAISSGKDYLSFLNKLQELPVPDIIKQPVNVRKKDASASSHDENVHNDSREAIKAPAILMKAKGRLSKGVSAAQKAKSIAEGKAEDLLRSKKAITRQILFYGLAHLYSDSLEEFINA